MQHVSVYINRHQGATACAELKGDDPDKKGYPGPPGWGFGVGLTIPHSKTKLFVTKVEQKKKLDGLNDDGRKETGYTERRWGELVVDRDIQREDGETWWQIGIYREKMGRVGGR